MSASFSWLLPMFNGRMAVAAGRVPLLHHAMAAAYERGFNKASGHLRIFRGVYPDFAAARETIPSSRIEGFDNLPSADRVAHERLRVLALDYPVMFWLCKLLPECGLLFDWGGNIGVSYFAYRKYLEYPSDLTWLVNDVPAVVRLGEMMASAEEAPGLRFSDTLEGIAQADVLLASGSLHFMDNPFDELSQPGRRPRHVLLNKVPIYGLPDAVTMQNMGTAFCPNHLFNRSRFLQEFEHLGYRLMDEWTSPELSCRIPFHPEHSIPAYSGFYFRQLG